MNSDIFISIIIPALNEEATIKNVISKIKNGLSNFFSNEDLFEIILIDDGSIDKTAEIAELIEGIRVYRNLKNMGKGFSMRKGALLSRGKYLSFIDSDNSHRVKDLVLGIKIIQYIEVNFNKKRPFLITGVRFSNQFHGTTKLNVLGNKIYSRLAYFLWKKKLHDLTCGLRFINKDDFLQLKLTSSRYSVEAEMIARALSRRYQIVEFPIIAKKRLYGKSGIRVLREGLIIPMAFFLASLNIFIYISTKISI